MNFIQLLEFRMRTEDEHEVGWTMGMKMRMRMNKYAHRNLMRRNDNTNAMIELRQAANFSDTHRFLFNHLITFCVKSHKVYD